MSNRLLLLAAGAFGVQVGVLLIVQNSNGRVPQPAALEIEPRHVQLGRMELDERRTVEVNVRNQSNRTVHLLPPEAGCACVEASLSSRSIPAGRSATMRFVVVAPSTPGEIARAVTLLDADSAQRWTIQVVGRAVAAVWSEPPVVRLQLNRRGHAKTTAVIRHAESLELGTIIATDPSIEIGMLPPGEHAQAVEISISSETDGSGSIAVLSPADFDASLLTIPVVWQTRPQLRCRPDRLFVDGSKRHAGDAVERTILVVTDPLEDAPVTVTPLVPWVRVVSQTKLNHNTTAVRIFLRLPKAFTRVNEQVLAVRLESTDSEEHYVVVSDTS